MARSSATVSAWRAQAPGTSAAINTTETLVRRMEPPSIRVDTTVPRARDESTGSCRRTRSSPLLARGTGLPPHDASRIHRPSRLFVSQREDRVKTRRPPRRPDPEDQPDRRAEPQREQELG